MTGNNESAGPQPGPATGWFFCLWGLLVVGVGLFFVGLQSRDLWSSHEARAAMDARSLLEPDTRGLPRLEDGLPELQKPPLFYWVVALTAWLRHGQVDALDVRLPAALSGALTVILVVFVANRMGRPLVGLLAGLVLAGSIHFPWLAHIGRIDMPLSLTVTAACLGFATFSGHRLNWVLPYLACTLGVLLKGPIGLALPLAFLFTWVLIETACRQDRSARTYLHLLRGHRLLGGLFIVAVLVVPVYAWIEHLSEGQFLREFLWLHNVERGLGGSRLRSHPWWLYAPYLLLYLLPFSPLLLLAARWRGLWQDPLARLGLAWVVGMMVLLSLARFKRADYLLPVYPGAALLIGCMLERAIHSARGRWVLRGVVGVTGIMLVSWVVRLLVVLPAQESYRDYRAFAALIRQFAPAPQEVVFVRTEAHALSFHVGRPLVRFVHYPQLQEYLRRAEEHYLVLPPDTLPECRASLPGMHLEEIQLNSDLAGGRHERPLLLVRATRDEKLTRPLAMKP